VSEGERLRCHHPSGQGMNSRCRRVAVATVRVKFGKRWSRWILACAEHEASDQWYQDDETGKWWPVERGIIDDWRPQKRRGQR